MGVQLKITAQMKWGYFKDERFECTFLKNLKVTKLTRLVKKLQKGKKNLNI